MHVPPMPPLWIRYCDGHTRASAAFEATTFIVHIWEAAIGEVLDYSRERDNANDCYVMAEVKSDTIVGHLPRKLSRILSVFARRGGVHVYTVVRRNSHELANTMLRRACS